MSILEERTYVCTYVRTYVRSKNSIWFCLLLLGLHCRNLQCLIFVKTRMYLNWGCSELSYFILRGEALAIRGGLGKIRGGIGIRTDGKLTDGRKKFGPKNWRRLLIGQHQQNKKKNEDWLSSTTMMIVCLRRRRLFVFEDDDCLSSTTTIVCPRR